MDLWLQRTVQYTVYNEWHNDLLDQGARMCV